MSGKNLLSAPSVLRLLRRHMEGYTTGMAELENKLKQIPQLPGIYQMLDEEGVILYVGKANKLRQRVQSYFRAQPDSLKTAKLASLVADIHCIVTENEREALILESNLIKEHKPRFNILLKDSKKYPFLRVTLHEDFPRIIKSREEHNKQDRYFGPFPDVSIIYHSIKLLHRLFPIRHCHRKIREGANCGKVCMYYHIGRCQGPCEQKVSRAEYRSWIDSALLFLEGNQKMLAEALTKTMQAHALKQEYEKAAAIRDQLEALSQTAEFQVIHQSGEDAATENLDVMTMQEDFGVAAFAVLQVRQYKLMGQRLFFEYASGDKPEIFAQFMRAYLSKETGLALPALLLPESLDPAEYPEGYTVIPENSPAYSQVMKRLLFHANRNARLALDDEVKARCFQDGLVQLQKLLKLRSIPLHIDGFDIANLNGEENVGAMVSFINGKPDKNQYRRFTIKSVSGQNDVASIKESVARQYQRSINEGRPLPDLVLIDGGKGQLRAAHEVFVSLGLKDMQVVSLAKKEELLFRPGRAAPIALPRNNFGLRILQQVRDEVHRYVNAFHAARRSRSRSISMLEAIPGIGPRTRQLLLKELGSVEAVARASVEELDAVLHSAARAQAVHRHFRSMETREQ